MNYFCPLCKNQIIFDGTCKKCRSIFNDALSLFYLNKKDGELYDYSVYFEFDSWAVEILCSFVVPIGTFISTEYFNVPIDLVKSNEIKIHDEPIPLNEFKVEDFTLEKIKMMLSFI